MAGGGGDRGIKVGLQVWEPQCDGDGSRVNGVRTGHVDTVPVPFATALVMVVVGCFHISGWLKPMHVLLDFLLVPQVNPSLCFVIFKLIHCLEKHM